MQNVIGALVENADLIIAIISVVVVWIADRDVAAVKRTATQLMLRLEKIAKEELQKSGPEKMAEVVSRLLALMPARVKALLGAYASARGMSLEELVFELAQNWYDEAVG